MKTKLGFWPLSRRQIRTLREPSPEMPSRDVFWSAFRTRAASLPQETSERYGGIPWRAPAFALALALLLAGGVWFRVGGSSPDKLQVEVLETGSDVYSYMIWDDVAGRGTLLWLMDSGNATEGGS